MIDKEIVILSSEGGIPMTTHKIITIGRQFGSGGHEIGNLLATRLDIPLYDNNLVRMAAEKMKAMTSAKMWNALRMVGLNRSTSTGMFMWPRSPETMVAPSMVLQPNR